MDAEISTYHSLISEGKISDPALHVHCVLYYYSIAYTSRIHALGSEVTIFVC